MVIIYSQDNTILKNDIQDAEESIIDLYGKKLGNEACEYLKDKGIGFSYRKNGGPLIKIISKEDAEFIQKKETEIGMM